MVSYRFDIDFFIEKLLLRLDVSDFVTAAIIDFLIEIVGIADIVYKYSITFSYVGTITVKSTAVIKKTREIGIRKLGSITVR